MKKISWLVGLVVLGAVAARAEAEMAITNWVSGYQYVAGTNTDTGTTGLPTNTAFVCIPMAVLNLTTNQADEAGGDWRALVYAVNEQFYVAYAASTNPPAKLVMQESVSATSRTNLTVEYKIRTTLVCSALTIEGE